MIEEPIAANEAQWPVVGVVGVTVQIPWQMIQAIDQALIDDLIHRNTNYSRTEFIREACLSELVRRSAVDAPEDKSRLCPVCGHEKTTLMAGTNICCCCGTDFRIPHAPAEILRRKWIKSMRWHGFAGSPDAWDPMRQLIRLLKTGMSEARAWLEKNYPGGPK